MGCKRQRAGELSRRRLSLALTALAWVAATTAAQQDVHVGDGSLRIRTGGGQVVPLAGPARLRWRRVLVDDSVGTVHAENDEVADSENREGSNAGTPTPAPAATTMTPAPSTTAPAPTSAVPVTTPTSRPPSSSSSSRGDETLPPVPAPSTPAPAPATTVPPPPPMTETTTPPPPPSTPPTTEDSTTQPAPTSQAPSSAPPPPPPAETTPAPTTSAPTTPPPPPPPTTAAPPPPPAPTSAPPPPATTPGPTQPPPPAATTPAPPPATTPKTTPAPTPTTAKPSTAPPAVTTPAPAVTTKAPTVTPSLTPTLTTKAPSNASGGTGAGANSGAGDDTAASDSTHDGNGKAQAPDLSALPPIAGSGVISKSNRTPAPGTEDDADAAKNKAPTSGLNNISTLGIAGIVVGVLAVVLLAILFVHVRRKRNEKDEDSARQRQLDDFFSGNHRAPIPRSGHPGAASLISNSSNGMTFIAPPNSLTPRDEIPIASSARFKQAPAPAPLGRPMSPTNAPARFDDNVLNQGRIVPKGRMYSIPASPSHGGDSSSGEFNTSSNGDSFMGTSEYLNTGEQSFYDNSSRHASDFSLRSSGVESRDTGMSRATSEARSTAYFPQGLSESRSTMVQMGLTHETSLPRGDAGDILIPVPRPVAQDDASTTFSVSDSEYGSPAPRDNRVDSSISSSSNQNPWALLTLDDALSRSLSPPTSIDESAVSGSSRGESQASALSDLPSSRSDNSYYMSDEDGRSTRAGSEFDVDSYDGSARSARTDSYGYTADSFTSGEGSARSARTDSYGYANSSFGDGSHLSFLSDRSTGFRPSQSGGPDVLEGHI